MAGINLLPWREWRRRRAIRRWQGLLLGCLLTGGLLSLLGIDLLDERLERQSEANAQLEQRIAGLAGDLEQVAVLVGRRDALQGQWNELQALLAQRNADGDLLFRLMEIVPPGARLAGLHLAEGALHLSGVARNGDDVAQLLRNLRQSSGLGAPDLQELVSSPDGERFRLVVALQPMEPT